MTATAVIVIADDLSGAAELAAAAAQLGWSAEVQTEFDAGGEVEVIAIDSDSRGLPPLDAARKVAAIAREALRLRPGRIYKKTDSVLRGNVRAEIEALMDVTGHRRALLVPANPSKGRIIRDGVYSVGGTPLAETAFAADPDHPRWSSGVLDLLGEAGRVPVARALADEDRGIVIPDVETAQDVRTYAMSVDEHTLPAGGVEFFVALVQRPGVRAAGVAAGRVSVGRRAGPTLFVCGSAQAWDQDRPARCQRHDIPLLAMPAAVRRSAVRGAAVSPPGVASEWSARIADAVWSRGCAMAAIGRGAEPAGGALPPAALAARLAEAVAPVLRRGGVSTVCVEGGATAAALLRALEWTRLTALPTPDLPGVAALRPGTEGDVPTILVKPGSYPWPEELWSEVTAEGTR